uniref:Uncharacterized protein n=1 Tax=Timema genevievae TaxID=629358 RepID=A0A7R9PQL9_TIMGE|nr:unnamed protein product [Timema genevievae]
MRIFAQNISNSFCLSDFHWTKVERFLKIDNFYNISSEEQLCLTCKQFPGMLTLDAGIVVRKLRTFPPEYSTNAMKMEPCSYDTSNLETESLSQVNATIKDELDEINTSKGKFCNVKVEEHFYGEIEPFSEEHSSERSVIKDELDEIDTSKGKFCNVKVEEHFYEEIEPFSEEHLSERSVIKDVLQTKSHVLLRFDPITNSLMKSMKQME